MPHAEGTLKAGFTTVRNVGANEWNDVGLRQAIDEGKVPGPRVVSAAWANGSTAGHCGSTCFPPSSLSIRRTAKSSMVRKSVIARHCLRPE